MRGRVRRISLPGKKLKMRYLRPMQAQRVEMDCGCNAYRRDEPMSIWIEIIALMLVAEISSAANRQATG
jgi:hypothetical protein